MIQIYIIWRKKNKIIYTIKKTKTIKFQTITILFKYVVRNCNLSNISRYETTFKCSNELQNIKLKPMHYRPTDHWL